MRINDINFNIHMMSCGVNRSFIAVRYKLIGQRVAMTVIEQDSVVKQYRLFVI